MSAAGRNLPGRERRAHDNYATPAWCTRAILPKLGSVSCVLDPCCGDGAILDVALEHGGEHAGIELVPSRWEQAKRRHYVRLGDALTEAWPSCTAVVTNPPYSLALEFVLRAFDQNAQRVDLAFLLRLGFLGSQKRAPFHREHPSDIYVLPRRPSYTGGGTDASEYAWFVWGRGRGGRWEILEVEA